MVVEANDEGVRDPVEEEGWEAGVAGEGGVYRGVYTLALVAVQSTSTRRCSVQLCCKRKLAADAAKPDIQKICAAARSSSRTRRASAVARPAM